MPRFPSPADLVQGAPRPAPEARLERRPSSPARLRVAAAAASGCLLLAASGCLTGGKPERLSEAGAWLQGYLRIDTTNPPGNEQRAADYLAGILQGEGISVRRWVSPGGRTSLSARLTSPQSGGRAVVLVHHMDVVPPGPDWSVPPFAGLVRDGVLWGRGAVDDKSLGIAFLAAFIELHRRGTVLGRDLIYLAVADEESGSGEGMEWLLGRHPEVVSGAEAVLGEGGRAQVAGSRLLWWGVEVAQKRPLWLEVTATGRGGHGSGLNPASAVHQLVGGLGRLLALPLSWRVTPPARAYLQAVAPLHNPYWQKVLSGIDGEIDERTGPRVMLLPGMANLFLDTIQVTVVNAGERINVIPESATAQVDARLLPDTDAPAFLARMRQALGGGLEARVLVTAPRSDPSPAAGRMWAAMSRVLGREAPVVPMLSPGFTDSRFFRQRGIPAYGISPFALAASDLLGIHGRDEHIPLAELDRGVARMRGILASFSAAH